MKGNFYTSRKKIVALEFITNILRNNLKILKMTENVMSPTLRLGKRTLLNTKSSGHLAPMNMNIHTYNAEARYLKT